MDSIFAIASAPGKAGVAVVRVSGPLAWECVKKLTGSIPEPRRTSLRRLRTQGGDILDEALVLVFSEGASFTGERVAEFHIHGSIATQRAVLRELDSIEGMRLAEPGEFTRRALENDRLDLDQVEALSDLIEAETESQRVQALRILSGKLGERVETWRVDLVEAASLLEACIDFADEEVPVDVTERVTFLVEKTLADIQQELRGVSAAERIRSGFEVAIVGAPNVGKSTLLNALAGRDAAITSEVAGTTRDVIEVRMEINGLPVTLLDTAGLRETDDVVEKIGIERAVSRASGADLRIVLVDERGLPEFAAREDDLIRRSKTDDGNSLNGISAKTGHGIETLLRDVGDRLSERVSGAGLASRERHRIAFESGASALGQGLAMLGYGPDRYELAAEELRVAIRALEGLIGRIGVENLLEEIFASFCIGK